MGENKAIIYQFRFDGSGGVIEDFAATGVAWVHLDARHADARKFLKETLHLNAALVKILLADETRPRLEVFDDNALIILRGVLFDAGAAPEDMGSVRVWAGRGFIVSLQRRKSKGVSDIVEALRQGRGPGKTGGFIAMLVEHLHDGISLALCALEDRVDDLEEQLLEKPGEGFVSDMAAVRRQAILFRRHLVPQREVIHRLQTARIEWMTETDRWHMQDNVDRTTRYIESLDTIRERAQVVQDEFSRMLASRLNKNLYVLSVITVIFMPLTFLTGMFGVNLSGIPGAAAPHAFPVFCLILGVLMMVELWLLRRMKWF